MTDIRITTGNVTVVGKLNDTESARRIAAMLPLEARVNRWGDEIYFPVNVSLELEDGREVVQAGDLGYWPEGPAFCIFFGRTPASVGDEIRAASPVSLIGKISGELKELKKVRDGAVIRVERLDEGQDVRLR